MEINRIALALSMTHNVVPGDWARLEGTPSDIWCRLSSDAGLAALGRSLGHTVGPVDWSGFEAQLERAERCGARVVSRWDAEYPVRLRHVASPPPVLFVRGDLGRARGPAVAIVGTRAPSAAGSAFASRLARAIAAQGIAVTSGLARGIDTAAHRGALGQSGGTVAVLGAGVDVVYPPENGDLMARVAGEGCLLSEQPCGTIPVPHVFPRRNRIISGVSDGVVVVEGGVKSGALITARWALDQGREVGAVPGFPGDFRCAGPNRLLKEGAFLVEDAADVFANLPWLVARAPAAADADPGAPLDEDEKRVYDLVTRDVGPDDIASASGLDVGRVQEILTRLEIDGRVARGASGRYARANR